MRYLRAALAALLLLLLVAGFPLVLALSVGNPLHGWDGLLAGDLSDAVLLDVLAAVAWIAWASFLWSVIGELAGLAAGASRPHLPALLPGSQQLAHTLITTAFLVLPSTAPLLGAGTTGHETTSLTALHTPSSTHAVNLTAVTPLRPPPPAGTSTQSTKGTPVAAPAHRATPPADTSSVEPSQFALGAGAGLVAGISLRELARLRRRQWRHRRPGQAIPSTPSALAPIEKTLHTGQAASVSDADRAQILAARADTQDQPMGPARGQAPWDAFCDAAGAPLPEFTLSESDPATAPADHSPTRSPEQAASGPNWTGKRQAQGRADDRPAPGGQAPEHHAVAIGLSVISQPTGRVLTTTATTARDLAVLAPQVQDRVRRLVRQADPELDDDLTQWHDPDTNRPRLSVLGPVSVRACGDLPSPRPRVAWHTEVLTYLAAHPLGVTPEKFGTDLWPDDPDITTKPKLRQALYVVRRWLGTNPRTGLEYIPQTKTQSGVALYRVEDLLSDAELFRRLRLRGITNGPQGIHDLETALRLVTSAPFDPAGRRRNGYRWLIDTPQDAECTAMIIDVAHVVATHHLSTGRPDLAAQAAHVSLTAGSRDDIPLLDLIAARDAEGHHAEAGHWIRQILANHDAHIEEDLPPRTAEILHRRKWHQVS